MHIIIIITNTVKYSIKTNTYILYRVFNIIKNSNGNILITTTVYIDMKFVSR